MAVSYIWPVTLPAYPLSDFSESKGVLMLRTPMDKGPAKLRRLGRKPSVLAVKYVLTSDQLETLNTFVFDTLRGTARFGYMHPRTRTQVEARFLTSGDGDFYTESFIGPDVWAVSFTLEVLP